MRGMDRSIFEDSSLMGPTTSVNTDRPALLGPDGAPEAVSSCTQVAVPIRHTWDTNGYYRELGVAPTATRRELRDAYIARDGQSSERLTYILKQLLNPQVRAEYDSTRLGDLFMDRYVAEMFERLAQKEAAEARASGADIKAEDVLKRWGLIVTDDDDTPDASVLDPDGRDRQGRRLSDPRSTVWPFRYYLWRTQHLDDGRLAIWQEQVRKALISKGVSEQFAVGLAGRTPLPFLVGKVGNRIAVFLNRDEQPSEAAAEKVAARVVEALHNERERQSA